MSELRLPILWLFILLFSGSLFATSTSGPSAVDWQGLENCTPGRYILPNLQVQVGRKQAVDATAEAELKRAAALLKACASPLVLEGHADSSGSKSANRQYSLQRAQWVRDWLIQEGLDDSLIRDAQGLGDESQPYPEQPRDAKNRTVVIHLQAAEQSESVVDSVAAGVAGDELLAQAQVRLNAMVAEAEQRLRALEQEQAQRLRQSVAGDAVDESGAQQLQAQVSEAGSALRQQVDQQVARLEAVAADLLARLEAAAEQPTQDLKAQSAAVAEQLRQAGEDAIARIGALAEKEAQTLRSLAGEVNSGVLATPAPAETGAEPSARLAGPADIGRILQRGKLVVAMLGKDVPPFLMTDKNGRFYGLDVKLAEGIAKELGVELAFNRDAKNFNDVVQEVIEGRADIAISKISRTLTRSKKVLFSRPYIVLRQGLLFNRLQLARAAAGMPEQEFVQKLMGPVAVIQNSSYEMFLRTKFPKATVMSMPNWDQDIIPAVVEGRVMAAYRDELEVKKIIRGKPKEVLRLKTVILKDTQDPIAMVLPHDSYNLQQWVNTYLDTIQLNYTADTLLDEYEEIFEDADAN